MNQESEPGVTEPNPNPGKWVIIASFFFLVSFSFSIASHRNAVDIDLFHEMALARQIFQEGEVPQTDAFAYTPTVERVVHHEWGTGAIVYAIVEWIGLKSNGLMVLKYLLVVLIGVACFVSASLRSATWPIVIPGLAMATVIGGQIGFTTIRAQVFTMLFLACEFCLLGIDQRKQKWWILPWLILVVVWANVHAGVVAGLGIFCFYVLFQLGKSCYAGTGFTPHRHLVAVAVFSFLLLLVNPYGINYPFYLWYGTTLDRPLINEWQPLLSSVGDSGFLTLFGISLAISMIGFAKDWRERPFEIFVVILTAYLAFKHVRHLSIYAVTWACIVPASLSRSPIGFELTKIGHRLATPFIVVATAGGILFSVQAVGAEFWKMQVPTYSEDEKPQGMVYPVGAVNYLLENEFEGNLMVPFTCGAFVSWNLFPNVKVNIDSRYEVAYPKGSIERSVDFYNAKRGWQDTLKMPGTDAVLIPKFKAVHDKVNELPDWHLLYSDSMYSIFTNVMPVDDAVITDEKDFHWEF